MDKPRPDGPISDIMRTPGDEKWRILAARGAATFLMLDGGPAAGPDRPPGHDDGDAALAAAAGDIYRGIPPAERDAWPGGVALALQMLAEQSFFPPVGPAAEPSAGHHGADEAFPETFRALAEGRYVRVVNFHATPRGMSEDLEGQLSRLAENFAPVSHDDLAEFVDRGTWAHDRPGVIVSFFDGYRDNYDVAAPILDRLGLIGWFFLVSGWVSARPEDQRAFAADNDIALSPYDGLPADYRLALSPEEVSDLAARGHVIASHTRTHGADVPLLGPEALAGEAAGSREYLEEVSGANVRALVWYAGMAAGVNPHADAALRDAGYDLLFANHAIQRVR